MKIVINEILWRMFSTTHQIFVEVFERPLKLSTIKYADKMKQQNENTINESLTNVLNINKDPN